MNTNNRNYSKNIKASEPIPRHQNNYQNPRASGNNYMGSMPNSSKQPSMQGPIPTTHHYNATPNLHYSGQPIHTNLPLNQMGNVQVAPQQFPLRPNHPRQNNSRNFQSRANPSPGQLHPIQYNNQYEQIVYSNPVMSTFNPFILHNNLNYPHYQNIQPHLPRSHTHVISQIAPPQLQQNLMQPTTSMPNDVIHPQIIDSTKIISSNPPQPIQNLPHPHPQPQTTQKRERQRAVIQDPNTLEQKNLDEMAKEPIPTNLNNSSNTSNTNQPPTNLVNHETVAHQTNKTLTNQTNEEPIRPTTQGTVHTSVKTDVKSETESITLTSKNIVTTKNVDKNVVVSKKETQPQLNEVQIKKDDKFVDKTVDKIVDKSVDKTIIENKQIEKQDKKLDKPIEKAVEQNFTPVPIKQDDKKSISTTNESVQKDVKSKDVEFQMSKTTNKLEKLTISELDKKTAIKENVKEEKLDSEKIEIQKAKSIKQEESKNSPIITDEVKVIESTKPQQPVTEPVVSSQLVPQKVTQQQTNQTDKPIDRSSAQQNVKAQPVQSFEVSDERKKASLEGSQSKSESKVNITYDVDFLKNLQYQGDSIKKPSFSKGNLDIILQEARRKNETFDFEPNFLRQPSNNRNFNGRQSTSMQMGQRMNSDQKIPRKIISSNSLNQDIKLRTTENAWKPDRIKNNNESFANETTEALIKRARGMLNKLTPQNFEKISNQFVNLEITTLDKLRKMIELIFDKAVDEPAFCDQYALLCTNMSSIQVLNDDGKAIKFNTLLLERCQTCFESETNKYKTINIDERLANIEKCTDKEKRQQLIDELDEDKRLIRKKSLGNIKLIGALYKSDRLKDFIMDQCIDSLIQMDDEDSYECLCSLLKSIGGKFELSTKEKAKFNSQMKCLEKVVRENKLPSRIRFLIMDILDMRKDNWKPRKLQDTNKPKTIEEVHEEAKKQEEQSNKEISQLGKRNDYKKQPNNAWMNQRKGQGADALNSIRQLSMQRGEIGQNINLGPPKFGQNFGPNMSNWSQGATGAKSNSIGDKDKKPFNQWNSRNNSSSNNKVEEQPKKSLFKGTYTTGNESTDIKLAEQYSKFLKQFIDSSKIEELCESIYSISSEECIHLFVRSAFEGACESFTKSIKEIGLLLAKLVVEKKMIPYQQFHKGLKYHLDIAEDILPDVPKFYEYIGCILSYLFNKIPDEDRKSFFKQALEPCLGVDTSILIIVHLIKHAIELEDVSAVAKNWINGKLSFEDFSTKQDEQSIKQLFIKHELNEFLNQLVNCKLVTDKSVELSKLVDKILNSKTEDLKNILVNNFGKKDSEQDKKIVSALIERFLLDSTDEEDGNKKFNYNKFENNLEILPENFFNNDELKMELIYSSIKVVAGDFKLPKEYLGDLFDCLLDVKIIKKDLLLRWFETRDNNKPGNTIALVHMSRYIQSLKSDLDYD